MTAHRRLIRIVSLTWAEEHKTNAQQVNAREIAARLDPDRFQVTLLSEGSGPAPVLDLPHVRAWRLHRERQSIGILRHLLGGDFDLLLYPGLGLPESIYVRLPRFLPCRRARILLPVEGDVGQYDEVPTWMRRRADRLLREADAVFPITEYVAQTLRSRCGRTGAIVPVGVDVGVFRPRATERTAGPLRILSVGTVKAWKRPELVRRAATIFPGMSFTWIGAGELLEGEMSRAPANLTFPGLCARSLLPSVYRDADVLLHPSRMEGLPKVILEALASGLPVIAFNDYHPRYLTEAGAGFVVSSEEEMLAALGALSRDSSLLARMGGAGRRLAEAYSWDVVATRWSSLFEREAALVRMADHAPSEDS